MKFRHRLLASYLLLILLPLIALGILFYQSSLNVVRKQAQTNMLEIVKKSNEVLDTKLAQIDKSSRALFVDEDMFHIFERLDPENGEQLLEADRKIKIILSKFFALNDDVYTPLIWTSYFTFGNTGYWNMPVGDPSKSGIYRNTVAADGRMVWSPTFDYSVMFQMPYLADTDSHYRYMFSASRVLNFTYLDYSTMRTLGPGVEHPVLAILFQADVFRSLFERSIPEGAVYRVVDKSGTVVAHSDPDQVTRRLDADWISSLYEQESGTTTMKLDGERKIVVFDRSGVTGWLSVVEIPESTLIKDFVPTLLTSTLSLAAVLGLIAIVLAYFISAGILGPVKKLMVAMRFVGEGDFHTRVEATSSDEFGILLQKFNTMNDRIQALVKENYEIKLREKDAEIVALNRQMNPHFLYNTLNVINWMAIEGGNKEVSKSLVSLSNMLHYTTRKDWGEVSLAEEMEWMKNYFYLMAVRFEDKFAVRYEIDPALYAYKVPRLLFQPFVENAILHGFDQFEQGGVIVIRGDLSDGYRRFEIEDNGKGMTEAAVRQLRGSDSPSVGLKNTMDRLRLQYGDSAQVHIQSETGKGTIVRILLPANCQE